jgi:ATP-binding cassette subfamily B protein
MVAVITPQLRSLASEEFRRRATIAAEDRLCRAVNSWPGLKRFETPSDVDRLKLAQEAARSSFSQLFTNTFSTVQATVTVVSFFAALLVISPILTGAVAATVLPALFARLSVSKRQMGVRWRLSPTVRREEFFRALQTDLRAAKEVRVLGIGDFFRGRMVTEMESHMREEARQQRAGLMAQVALGLMGSIVTGVGLLWTVSRVATGQLTIGDISLFIMAAFGVQSSIGTLTGSIAGAHQALQLARHYVGVVESEPEMRAGTQGQRPPALHTGIEVRDVWFRYNSGATWALRGVSLSIPYGASVALVGANGAGKSTLVKLLCRFYDPERGAILWDGTDIREFDPKDLREHLAVVFQDFMTYDLTARENIGIGDVARLSDLGAVRWAAARAGLDETVLALPDQYDTLLSRVFGDRRIDRANTGGSTLSGGQWQRLAIARALMRADRDLLILDEPSSGLDARAESELHAVVRELGDRATSVIVSHRLGLARHASRIYVLDEGKVAEQGSHAELMAADSEYRGLFLLQAQDYGSSSDGDSGRNGSEFRGATVEPRSGRWS